MEDAPQEEKVPSDSGLLAAIMETAVDSIIVIDRHGIVRQVNPAIKKQFGFDPSEVLGNNVSRLMPEPFRGEHDQHLDRYHRTGEQKIIGIGREVIGQRKDGSTFPIHVAVSEFKVDGETLFAGMVRDISDLKEAQRRLHELNTILDIRVRERTEALDQAQEKLLAKEKFSAMGQISGGIAHEIRNPLNAVKTSCYFLLHAESLSEEKRLEHLERIDRQVNVIDNVITVLSNVAKLPDPQLGHCDLADVIANAIADVSGLDQIEIDNQLLPGSFGVVADRNQLPIVFRNLIRNARDAMPSGGRLIIAAQVEGGQVRVSVADTGEGVSADHLQKILEPFYSTKPRGMGLGLSICKTIVKKNGGTLRVESELKRGSTFFVCFAVSSEKRMAPGMTQ